MVVEGDLPPPTDCRSAYQSLWSASCSSARLPNDNAALHWTPLEQQGRSGQFPERADCLRARVGVVHEVL